MSETKGPHEAMKCSCISCRKFRYYLRQNNIPAPEPTWAGDPWAPWPDRESYYNSRAEDRP